VCKNEGKASLQTSINEKWEEILHLSSPLEGSAAKPAVHPLHLEKPQSTLLKCLSTFMSKSVRGAVMLLHTKSITAKVKDRS